MDNNSNMLQLCRLCLVKDDVNIPIFEEQGDIRQIFLKISSCLPVKVSRDDRLPKKICDGCSYKLDMLYEFWNTSANAEKQLLTWLGEAGMTSQMADGTISAVAQQIKPADTFVKQETIDPPDIHSDDDDKDYVYKDKQEDKSKNNVDEPPPKRARRTAAVKAAIAMDQDSDDDDSGEPMTKVEDDSDDSDNDDHEPAFVDVPSTSADDQPGPSGVGKDGVEAPNKATGVKCLVCQKDFCSKSYLQLHIENLNQSFYCIRCTSYGKQGSIQFPICSCPQECRMCVFCQKMIEEKDLCGHRCFHDYKNIEDFKMRCMVCQQFFSENQLVEHLAQVKRNECFYCKSCCIYFKTECHPLCFFKKKSCAFCFQEIQVCKDEFHTCFHESTTEDFETLEKTMTVECDFCDKRCHKDYEYAHRKLHDYVTCEICQTSIHVSILLHHTAKKHLSCYDCGMKFKNFEEYEPHKKMHKFEKMSTLCEICGKNCKASTLPVHVRKHTRGKTIVKCEKCGKPFPKKYMKRHMLVHSDEHSHTCPTCGKGFKIGFNLRVHMRSHDQVKPFECLVCHKTFTTKQWRDNHLRTHKVE